MTTRILFERNYGRCWMYASSADTTPYGKAEFNQYNNESNYFMDLTEEEAARFERHRAEDAYWQNRMYDIILKRSGK